MSSVNRVDVMEHYARKAEELSEFYCDRQLTQAQLHLFLLYDLLATGSFSDFIARHNFAQPINAQAAQQAKLDFEDQPLNVFERDAATLYCGFLNEQRRNQELSHKPSF